MRFIFILFLALWFSPASAQWDGCSAGFCAPASPKNLSLHFDTGTYIRNGVTASSFANFLSTSGSTFTRSTIGYDICADTQFAINTARIANNVLLYEPTATNVQFQSQFATGWTAQNATLTPNNSTAPDGTTTAATLVEQANTNSHDAFAPNNPTGALAAFTYSVFVHRASGTRNASILLIDQSSFSHTVQATLNLSTNTVSIAQSNGTTAWGNPTTTVSTCGSFQRFTMTSTIASTSLVPSFNANIYLNNGTSTVPSYLGDGTSGLVYYGAQIEQNGVATSYFPTTTAAGTRGADAFTVAVPSGLSTLTITFSDNSTQVIGSATGSYLLPTSINESQIKSMVWS